MSGKASGLDDVRQRERIEEEDAQSSMQMASGSAAELPPMLLALVKAHFDTLVWLQLCNPQGVALFSFVRLPPRVPRPFAGAPVYDMSLTHAERLSVVGCGFNGKLVRLLSLGVGRHFEPQSNWGACHLMMQSIARRVAAGLAAAVRDKVAKEAEEICASGQCAAAVVPLQRAIAFGDLPSRALMAWLLINGREGVAQDRNRAFELAQEGARVGCHHYQGVMAYCYLNGCGCERDSARSLELARESSANGSRYGQFTLGWLHAEGRGGLAMDGAKAFPLFRLAALQGLDAAEFDVGCCYLYGDSVAQDYAEALRLFHLAAAQGHADALYKVAHFHRYGHSVPLDVAEAVRWYRRAQAAGHPNAAHMASRLSRRANDDGSAIAPPPPPPPLPLQ